MKTSAGRKALGDFAPDFAHFNDDILFGENWNNPAIDLKTRCIITVAALMASGMTDSSLTYHLQNAKVHGVTKEEIAAVITHAAFYAGWPKAWAVFNQAKMYGPKNLPFFRTKKLTRRKFSSPLEIRILPMRNTSSVRVISIPFPRSRCRYTM